MRRRWNGTRVALGALVVASGLAGITTPSPASAGTGAPSIVAGVEVPATLSEVGGDITAMTIDTAGRIVFATRHRVFRAEAGGALTVLAGSGSTTISTADGPALQASLSGVTAIATDVAGNIYVVDNMAIRKVSTSGTISLVAGLTNSMTVGADGAVAVAVSVLATSVAVGPNGDVYFGTYDGALRKVVAATGLLATVVTAGFPRNCATLDGPANLVKADRIGTRVVVDAAGTVYASATCGATNAVLRVVGGTSIRIAGGGVVDADGALATSAFLHDVTSLSIANGKLFIGATSQLLRLDADGTLHRVAGSPNICSFVDGTSADQVCAGSAIARADGTFVMSTAALPIQRRVRLGVIANGSLHFLTPGADPANGSIAAHTPLMDVMALAAAPDGTLYFATATYGEVHRISTAGLIDTVAGNGTIGTPTFGGSALSSALATADDLAVSVAGEVYITQVGVVAKVTAAGTIVRVAGTGTPGDGPDSTAAGAALTTAITPLSVTTDAAGNVYIASLRRICNPTCVDTVVVREVRPSGAISTVYTGGGSDFAFDLATDIDGTLILSSYMSESLVRIDPSTGVSTAIPLPEEARRGKVAFDRDGTLFIANATGLWKRPAGGTVTKLADARSGFWSFPPAVEVAVDGSGNVYAAWDGLISKFPATADPDPTPATTTTPTTTTAPGVGSGGPTGSTAMLAPVSPVRLFDTRPGEEQGAVSVTKQKYGGPDNVLRVKIAGVASIPATGVGAVSLNVTVAEPDGSGFVTIYPCGERPNASSLNFVAGQVVPNAVIAPVSATGEICLFSNVPTHLLADVNGWFRSGAGLTPLSPSRLFDTRPGEAQGSIPVTKQTYGGPADVLKVKVTGASGVPETGVGAVSLNVTVAGPEGSGFVTVYPCGERPNASSLNFVAGQVAPNAVIAPVSASGEICFFSNVPTHLLADVNGWFAKASGFNALSPVRVFDTRPGEAQGAVTVTKQTYSGAGNVLKVKITNAAGVPESGVGAVSLNVTVAGPEGSGFVTVYPCGERPNASSLNFVAGQVVPNAVIAPVSATGEICFFSNVPTHLLADINGWFAA